MSDRATQKKYFRKLLRIFYLLLCGYGRRKPKENHLYKTLCDNGYGRRAIEVYIYDGESFCVYINGVNMGSINDNQILLWKDFYFSKKLV